MRSLIPASGFRHSSFVIRHFFRDRTAPVQALVLILGSALALSFPARVFTGVLEAFARYEWTTLTSIVRTLITTAAMWWVLRAGGELLDVVVVAASGGLLHRALNYFF